MRVGNRLDMGLGFALRFGFGLAFGFGLGLGRILDSNMGHEGECACVCDSGSSVRWSW